MSIHTDPSTLTRTLYIPFTLPPTPSPSPVPPSDDLACNTNSKPSIERRQYLNRVLHGCTPAELVFISQTIIPLLKRDFLSALPPELAVHILSFVYDPKTLVHAGMVSRAWKDLVAEEHVWKGMCASYGFGIDEQRLEDDPALVEWSTESSKYMRQRRKRADLPFSYRRHFRESYITGLVRLF